MNGLKGHIRNCCDLVEEMSSVLDSDSSNDQSNSSTSQDTDEEEDSDLTVDSDE